MRARIFRFVFKHTVYAWGISFLLAPFSEAFAGMYVVLLFTVLIMSIWNKGETNVDSSNHTEGH